MPIFGQCSRASLPLVVSAGLMLAVVSTACSNSMAVTDRETRDGLQYTSESSQASETPFLLVDTILVTNVGRDTTSAIYGQCLVSMRAYRSADRSGTPIYDQAAGAVCPDYLIRSVLSPGASIPLVGKVSGANLQAAGVRPGHYWFAAVVVVNGVTIDMAAGDATYNP